MEGSFEGTLERLEQAYKPNLDLPSWRFPLSAEVLAMLVLSARQLLAIKHAGIGQELASAVQRLKSEAASVRLGQ